MSIHVAIYNNADIGLFDAQFHTVKLHTAASELYHIIIIYSFVSMTICHEGTDPIYDTYMARCCVHIGTQSAIRAWVGQQQWLPWQPRVPNTHSGDI